VQVFCRSTCASAIFDVAMQASAMNPPIPHHVQQFGTRHRVGRQRLGAVIRSNRFTFGVALILAIIIPELLHPVVNRDFEWVNPLIQIEPSLIFSTLALLGAHVVLRRVGILPLVDDKLLILPVFLSSYTVTYAALVVILRTFSLYHLVTSFTIGLTWYYLMAVMRARVTFPRLAIVGPLPSDPELLGTRIEWVQMTKPRLPRNVLGIVFDRSRERTDQWDRLFSRAVLRNIPVYDLSQLREMVMGRVRLQSRPVEVFGYLRPSQPYLRIKRVIDTAVAVPALILLLPILALLIVAIRLDSPGPGIFRQTRVGYQGRRFTCYKLRTMFIGKSGPDYTEQGDMRITQLGRTLRKWRLDELPQLVNVLRGEMSWIGPRPEAVGLARQYERLIPNYAYRHAVRPGISGWAAVHQGNVALEDAVTVKLEYDFYYLKNFSVSLDFLTLLMSIRTIITGFGHR
jgi:lipopolysaccharide/colanic/teichoic acid biosynthesis glycosyltransferase